MESKFWRWTKRGIFATVICAVILSVGAVSLIVITNYRIAQFDRTYERPLQVDPDNRVLVSAHRLLAELHPTLGDNRLQFAVMPSFGKRWFAVSLAQCGGKGVGQAIIVQPDGRVISRRSFELSRNELMQFFDIWDAISDGYSGEGRGISDGSSLAFERQRGRRFTSGVGNSPCHYDVLGDWAAQRLISQVPELSDLREPMLAQMLKTDICNTSIFSLK